MQKAQELSQPIWIVTQPAQRHARAGPASAEGNCSWSSADGRLEDLDDRALGARPGGAARRPGATLWVPSTTSTCGARSLHQVAVLLGEAAGDHDLHARALRSLSDFRWPRVP